MQVIRANSENRAVEALPGEKVELTYGDKLRVHASLEYMGPRVEKATLYGAIGVRGATFTEKVHGETEVAFPKADIFTPWSGSVDIPITADIKPGTDYDLYVKLDEFPNAGMPEVDNVIDIIGIPPTFTLIQHTIYPSYYTYDGQVEVSTFTARISPFAPSNWAAERFATEMKNQVEAKGEQVIEMKVYVDISALLWTDIKVELTATPIASTEAIGHMTTGLGPAVAAIIIIVLAIIGIVVLTWSVLTIIKQFKHQALSEALKKTWSRETLISVIGDFEKKLNRTPTPSDQLQGMGDQQLRDYCDEMAVVIAPPGGVSWLPWIAIGAVAVVGVGAAVALSRLKK